MKLISKIEIYRFRSISNATIELEEINIFSGKNNSGKSNILKALDLFFNFESGSGQKFDFNKDYNKAFTGRAGGKRIAKITIHFIGRGEAALKEPFSIERVFEGDGEVNTIYHSTNIEVQRKLRLKDGRGDGPTNRQFKIFLGKIKYFYIPAVRDKNFVKKLFLEFKQLIEIEPASKQGFADARRALSDVLDSKSKGISADFEKFIGLPTRAVLSSEINDILGAIEINVTTGIKVVRILKGQKQDEYEEVDLFSSGDGILMTYLAYFLAHVCKKISDSKKYSFIWGFEEPENSLEYSKVETIADKFFSDFKENAQILITTHSPAFINLRGKADIKFYRIYIDPSDDKQISKILTLQQIKKQLLLFKDDDTDSDQYNLLSNELRFVEFSRALGELSSEMNNEVKKLQEERKKFEKENKAILDRHPEKIFVCEDSSKEVKDFWQYLLNIFDINDIAVLSSGGSTTKNIEIWARQSKEMDKRYHPKIFRQVDRDGLTDGQIKIIGDKLLMEQKGLIYDFQFLPVNEFENFAIIENENFSEDFWNQNEEKIVESFELTAQSRCKALAKKLDKDDKDTFKYFQSDSGENASQMQSMRRDAKKNWKKYFPGKEMISAHNAIKYLTELPKEKLPEDLKNFIKKVEIFFKP